MLVSGAEIHELTEYQLSRGLNRYLGDVIGFDIEHHQDDIKDGLDICMAEYYEVPNDYKEIDVPQDRKNFQSFIGKGKKLRARDAAALLGYMDTDAANEYWKSVHHVPRTFAEEIAIVSIYQAAKHTDKADDLFLLPVHDLSVYREVQALPSAEDARRKWAQSMSGPRFSHSVSNAYYTEFKRRREAEDAGNSLQNAYEIANTYGFSLADAVKKHLEREK